MSSIYNKYNSLLLKRPFLTNFITTGFLFGTGDYLAQTLFTEQQKQYDYLRTLRAMVYGSFIFSPIGDRWYKLLPKIKAPFIKDRKAVNKTRLNIYDSLARVGCDQLIFAPFIGIPLYYTMMSIFELSESPLQLTLSKLQNNWWNTLKTNWLVWPIFQLFNFYLVPVHFRLLTVNLLSIGWNCYLSYLLNSRDIGVAIEQMADIPAADQVID